jgi:hypothetical protein
MKVEGLLFTVHQTPAEQAASQTIEHATTDSAQNFAYLFDVEKL